jgi:hypothetical protein
MAPPEESALQRLTLMIDWDKAEGFNDNQESQVV